MSVCSDIDFLTFSVTMACSVMPCWLAVTVFVWPACAWPLLIVLLPCVCGQCDRHCAIGQWPATLCLLPLCEMTHDPTMANPIGLTVVFQCDKHAVWQWGDWVEEDATCHPPMMEGRRKEAVSHLHPTLPPSHRLEGHTTPTTKLHSPHTTEALLTAGKRKEEKGKDRSVRKSVALAS